jgi:hypothetical protein
MLARTKISAKKIYTEYTAEQVWTAAAVAQRINGSYVKYDLMDFDATPPQVLKENSKSIMQKVLDGVIAPGPEDVDRGVMVRDHFRGKVMDLLAGRANDFTQVAIAATETDVFSSKDRLAFAIVASLPNSYERDVKRETVDQRVSSAQGGLIGSVIESNQLICRQSNKQTVGRKIIFPGAIDIKLVGDWGEGHAGIVGEFRD